MDWYVIGTVDCEYHLKQDQCQALQVELGSNNRNIDTEFKDNWPPGCYAFSNSEFWYNKNTKINRNYLDLCTRYRCFCLSKLTLINLRQTHAVCFFPF